MSVKVIMAYASCVCNKIIKLVDNKMLSLYAPEKNYMRGKKEIL